MVKRAQQTSSDEQTTPGQPDSNEAQSAPQPIKKVPGKWIELPVFLRGLTTPWPSETFVLIEFHTGTLELRALSNEALRLIKSGKENYPATGKPLLWLSDCDTVNGVKNDKKLVILGQVYRVG